MNRDKKFIIDSIKMDLFRVITATGDIQKEIPIKSVKEFLVHADQDFEKIELAESEKKIRKKLRTLYKNIDYLQDPKVRLRWTEDIMTARSLL